MVYIKMITTLKVGFFYNNHEPKHQKSLEIDFRNLNLIVNRYFVGFTKSQLLSFLLHTLDSYSFIKFSRYIVDQT